MIIIGIAGGSGSGKTTVVNKIIELLPKDSVSVMSQDAYYWDNGHLPAEEKKKINFDHPDSIEWDLLIRHLDVLKSGYSVEMPMYTYTTCARSEDTITIKTQGSDHPRRNTYFSRGRIKTALCDQGICRC